MTAAVLTLREELGKLAAFGRRDLLVNLSYRLAFVSDVFSLVMQSIVYGFIGKLVPTDRLPVIGHRHVDYLSFVAVGIALSGFVALGLARVVNAIRQEQLIGTLDSLLLTPTAFATLQIGSAVYDLLYVPVRTVLFFAILALGFGVSFSVAALPPAVVVLLAFIPFVWGLGIMSAALVLTFKRGVNVIGFATTLLTVGSGAYFPLSVLPGWASTLAAYNPMAVAMDAERGLLLGDAGWHTVGSAMATLVPASLAALLLGSAMFRYAVRRERRRGTIGLY